MKRMQNTQCTLLTFFMDLRDEFRRISAEGRWREHAIALTASTPTNEVASAFSVFWIEQGHRIREQIEDDKLLVRLLRLMLPAYAGPDVEIFRGENKQRWELAKVGFAWSPNIEIGRLFAEGLNSVKTGGVLLKAVATPVAIISGPVAHSNYLGECQFTVDPSLLDDISVVQYFPAL